MSESVHTSALRRVVGELDPAAVRWFAKADKLRACAVLLVPEHAKHTMAITELIKPCEGKSTCTVGIEALHRSGLAAFGRSAGPSNRGKLDEEYQRLYGSGDGAPAVPLPLVPACACSYLSDDSDGSLDDVLAAYANMRFEAYRGTGRCPGHIANELDFLAHCLVLAASGDEAALVSARDFTISHLFPWGVVFAAATLSRSQHPVTHFAAEALEHLLFCELSEARALE